MVSGPKMADLRLTFKEVVGISLTKMGKDIIIDLLHPTLVRTSQALISILTGDQLCSRTQVCHCLRSHLLLWIKVVLSETTIVCWLIHNTMVRIETTAEAQASWIKDGIEAEAELHMVGIEDEYLKLPKLTHTFPTTQMYLSVQLHAEMSRRLRETDIRRANLCPLQEKASYLHVKHIFHHESTTFSHQETRRILYGTISLRRDEKTTTDEMACPTSEAGMRMGEEMLEAMIAEEVEALGVEIGIDRRYERGIRVIDIVDDVQDTYRLLVRSGLDLLF